MAHGCRGAGHSKQFYLTPWFFVLRTVLYFAIWTALAIWVRSAWAEPKTHDRGSFRRIDRLCA